MVGSFISAVIGLLFIMLMVKLSLWCIKLIGKLAWFFISLLFTLIGFFFIGLPILLLAVPIIILGLLL